MPGVGFLINKYVLRNEATCPLDHITLLITDAYTIKGNKTMKSIYLTFVLKAVIIPTRISINETCYVFQNVFNARYLKSQPEVQL